MPRDLVPSREGPRREISTELKKHNRPFTGAKASKPPARGSKDELIRKDFEVAVKDLAAWHPATAVERMQLLPIGLLEMYLLAEEVGQAREFILRAFPKPGAKARLKYLSGVSA